MMLLSEYCLHCDVAQLVVDPFESSDGVSVPALVQL